MALFTACDKEFNNITSDVLGQDNANFKTIDTVLHIAAYNKKLDSLQINGLASNLLGVFQDPAYGQTKASIITQITPTRFSPNFGENPVIDDVILNIPYFSTVVSIDDDGNAEYKLDSLYGNPDATIKLTIYRSKYFLRDIDPNEAIDKTQKYFSKGNNPTNAALNGTSVIQFDDHIVDVDSPIYEDITFKPSNLPIEITTGEGEDAVTTRLEPAFRKALDNDYWKEVIIEKEGDPVLSSANNFKNYFRGLYFKVEATSDDGSMILLNLASSTANITINYTYGPTDTRIQSSYTLTFSGNRLNTFVNNYDVVLEDGDEDLGDERLYLKGTEGSMAVVDLFSGEVEYEDVDGNVSMIPAIDHFKKTYRKLDKEGNYIKDELTRRFLLKKLINEAQLVIHEDDDITVPTDDDGNYHKYDRIYAYDIQNESPTIDYNIDQTENNSDPLNSKIISMGQRDENGKFKIRLTQHLNNILVNDSTNTKIGLTLSTNVNYTSNSDILKSGKEVTSVPSASIISPRGTILYGSKEIPNKEDKKLQLRIFLTEPDLN
jgi:hypothetical protein